MNLRLVRSHANSYLRIRAARILIPRKHGPGFSNAYLAQGSLLAHIHVRRVLQADSMMIFR
jgi:hypothetical protein